MTMLRSFGFLLVTLFSCSLETVAPKPSPDIPSSSVVRTWYINPLDDRLSYEFGAGGVLNYHYFNSGRFATEKGSWEYRNDDHTSLVVRLPNEVDQPYFTLERHTTDAWYNILEENDTKMHVSRDTSGPGGRGLGTTTELLKTINTPSLILPALVGKWYYDAAKDGRWLYLEETGNCYYYHLQSFLGGSDWVSHAGVWFYRASTNQVWIFMDGELDYPYPVLELSNSSLKLGYTDKGAGSIYSTERLYR